MIKEKNIQIKEKKWAQAGCCENMRDFPSEEKCYKKRGQKKGDRLLFY